jgi:hypothetical protein
MIEAKDDILASMSYLFEQWKRIYSNIVLEQLQKEVAEGPSGESLSG